jgi:hypothetical protein
VLPVYLKRGLSLKSLSLAGGPVFAISVTVLDIHSQMVKIVTPDCDVGVKSPFEGAKGVVGGRGGGKMVLLDAVEANELRNLVSKRRSKAEDELDGDEELSLSALLDYMGCDDWLVQAFVGMESGRDCDICQYSAEQLREIEKTKNKLQQARQELGMQKNYFYLYSKTKKKTNSLQRS